jgi:hypothetical protein
MSVLDFGFFIINVIFFLLNYLFNLTVIFMKHKILFLFLLTALTVAGAVHAASVVITGAVYKDGLVYAPNADNTEYSVAWDGSTTIDYDIHVAEKINCKPVTTVAENAFKGLATDREVAVFLPSTVATVKNGAFDQTTNQYAIANVIFRSRPAIEGTPFAGFANKCINPGHNNIGGKNARLLTQFDDQADLESEWGADKTGGAHVCYHFYMTDLKPGENNVTGIILEKASKDAFSNWNCVVVFAYTAIENGGKIDWAGAVPSGYNKACNNSATDHWRMFDTHTLDSGAEGGWNPVDTNFPSGEELIAGKTYYLMMPEWGGCSGSDQEYNFTITCPGTPQEDECVKSWNIGAGENGENVKATIADGVLTVTGTGAIKDFPVVYDDAIIGNGSTAPWFWDNVTFNGDSTAVLTADRSLWAAEIRTAGSIPEGITNIPAGFFYDEAVATGDILIGDPALPSTIKTVGARAFSGHNYASIILPEGLETIGSYAFKSESAPVRSITIPSSVTAVGDYGLDMPLTEITVEAATPPEIADSTFASVDRETATVCVPRESVAAYKAADVWKEFKNIGYCSITEETLPYESDERTFADDIMPLLTGSYPDKNKDGVVAVKFTTSDDGRIVADCDDFEIYLFNSEDFSEESLVDKGFGSIGHTLCGISLDRRCISFRSSGTYWLVIDDDRPTDNLVTKYNLSIKIDNGNGVTTADRTVKSVTNYDILGRQAPDNATGIVIKRITYDDGSIKTVKEYVKD